jgi:hypothetical protein
MRGRPPKRKHHSLVFDRWFRCMIEDCFAVIVR